VDSVPESSQVVPGRHYQHIVLELMVKNAFDLVIGY
jgi:hypothetical protein